VQLLVLLGIAIRCFALFTCFHVLRKTCIKFGHLILGKIIKFVGTRCWILRLKGTKFNFGWGSAPDPARGAYSAPPRRIHQGQGGCGCPDPQNFHGGGRVRVLRVILAKSCDESAFSIHSSCRLRHTVNEAYM